MAKSGNFEVTNSDGRLSIIRKISENYKIATFSRQSGTIADAFVQKLHFSYFYLFSDFNQDKPPTTCAFDELTGEDKFCCQDLGADRQRVREPQAPQFPSYPCIDHTSHCSRWVKNEPKSCSPEHKSYPFMRESCQKTCGRCGDKVKVSQI